MESRGKISSGRACKEDFLVQVSGLSKKFSLFSKPLDRLRLSTGRSMTGIFGGAPVARKEFWALRDVSFTLEKGGALGVIGENGAGKSTLLQILAGISAPTAGSISVKGSVGALLELGSGFHPEFTGRRNVFLAGAVLGFTRKKILSHLEEIMDFAEIGDFFDQPVRTYSSGMFLRLAFAVNACLSPDLLLVDEILSVGDVFFQQKCHRRMESLLEKGAGLVLVSHDITAIQKYSRQTLLLDKGLPVFMGETPEAVGLYHGIKISNDNPSVQNAGKTFFISREKRNAEFETVADENKARLFEAGFSGENTGSTGSSFQTGEVVRFDYSFEILEDILTPVAALQIVNRLNLNVHGKSSLHAGARVPAGIAAGSVLKVMQSVRVCLDPGEYSIGIGLGEIPQDIYENAGAFDPAQLEGMVHYFLMARISRPLVVKTRIDGLKKPFFGIADLPGTLELEVVGPGGKDGSQKTDERPSA